MNRPVTIPPRRINNGEFRKVIMCARDGCDEKASSSPSMRTIDGEACCSIFCVYMLEEEMEELKKEFDDE